MALIGKERATSLAPSVVITSATLVGNGGKASAFEVSKLDPFAGSRFKFKAFYTQMRLGI
jgi:hypothetical protein